MPAKSKQAFGTIREMHEHLGVYPSFEQYKMLREDNDVFGQIPKPSAPQFPSPANPNTMDKLAMMPPDQLAHYVMSVYQRQMQDPSGGKEHIITSGAWERMFGSNVFKMLMQKKVLVRGPENGLMINQAMLV